MIKERGRRKVIRPSSKYKLLHFWLWCIQAFLCKNWILKVQHMQSHILHGIKTLPQTIYYFHSKFHFLFSHTICFKNKPGLSGTFRETKKLGIFNGKLNLFLSSNKVIKISSLKNSLFKNAFCSTRTRTHFFRRFTFTAYLVPTKTIAGRKKHSQNMASQIYK